jgi:hypothetical protein
MTTNHENLLLAYDESFSRFSLFSRRIETLINEGARVVKH